MKVTPELIEKINEASPIAEVMAEYGMTIRYDGKALCPFHEEDTPSFQVYPETNSYHCYGCGAGTKKKNLKRKDGTEVEDGGSDVIGFVMNVEAVSFPEACKILMRRAGIPIPDEKVDMRLEKAKDAVMMKNRRYYTELIHHEEALDYFYERGLDIEDIKKWRLGFVPHNDQISKYKGRLVFSIMEEHYRPNDAKTIALAYRKLDDREKGPKYINDPSSDIYHKSEVLYGLNFALPHIKKRRRAIVMEGYMDTIWAHKAGLEETVATCGTSFTTEQIKKLRRYTDQLILWYDGDAAGEAAMIRALPDLLQEGFSVRIVDSKGEDPADVMKRLEGDLDKLHEFILLNTKPAVQLVIDKAVQHYEALLNRERIKALRKALPIVESIIRPEEKFNYENLLRQKLGLS